MNQYTLKKGMLKMNQLALLHNKEVIKILIDKDYMKPESVSFPYRLSKEEIDFIRDERF